MEVAMEDEESRAELRARLLSNEVSNDANNDDASTSKDPELPLSLKLLYGLNGVTLSLPMTALLYIVNTRAAIPVAYLSAYSAVAFLPCSLKPFYACVSHHLSRQNYLLILLLILNGICTAGTAFIPNDGAVCCFVFAFLRGVASSWPEFLLGLALIRHARQSQNNFASSAAHLQSQAATARNLGSFLATIVAFGIFIHQTLNDQVVTILLVASGMLNLLAAMIAWWFHVGSNVMDRNLDTVEDVVESLEDINDDTLTSDCSRKLWNGNGRVVVAFQLCIIAFATQEPIESITSQILWSCLMLALVAALLTSVCLRNQVKWQRIHRVGLFLILRNAIPDSSYIMGSFIYSQLQSTPLLLQALSIVNMGTTTLSSWSYGKLLARYSHGWSLLMLMVGTTVASSLLSLGNLAIVAEAREENRPWILYLVTLFVGTLTTFVGEWRFLPDVVLATATVGAQGEYEESERTNIDVEEDDASAMVPLVGDDVATLDSKQYCCTVVPKDDSTGIQYGTLISCIDFGDQIGSWLTVPFVTALGISRENDWAGLNGLIILTSVLGLLSVLMLVILKDERI